MTITELCHELNNYFDRDFPKFHGAITIEGGKIVDADFQEAIKPGQYFRIIGSVLNDGVYKNDESLVLTDELFIGSIWLLAIPKEFVDLCAEMTEWEKNNNKEALSPFTSESFGGYSYSKGSAGKDSFGGVNSMSVFGGRLVKYRRDRNIR